MPLRLPFPRPVLSPAALNLLVATYIMAAFNATFWRRGAEIFAGDPRHLVLFGVILWALTLFFLTFAGPRRAQKPVAIATILLCAVTSWYQDRLGATIDREMIQNVMLTTFTEAHHLITPGFVLHVLLWGGLPSALVALVRVRRRPMLRAAAAWAGMAAGSLALFFGLLWSDMQAWSAVIRNHRELYSAHQPFAPVSGIVRYAKQAARTATVVVAPLGRDAAKGPRLAAAEKPVVTLLFVGETARAANWGLDGYARDTTPELRKRDVIAFTDVSSCGTATAVSVPCMFSALPQADYSETKAAAQENLVDVLTHAGVKVEWYDNNTGDQHVATRTGWSRVGPETDAAACAGGECTDAVFLPLLEARLSQITEDTVLVFHMIGSHGPSYFLRYPEAFRRFTPDCRSAEFSACTPQEIINAYDNSLLMTDHVLAAATDILARHDRLATAMYFVSDHGESLGEDGLYLHGAPRFMAPAQQTHVPMVLWLSPAWQAAMGVPAACLGAKAAAPASHDNLFSTVLGLMDIRTAVRDPALDLTAGCGGSES